MESQKNPFRRSSSKSQRLSYFLPDYKEWQDTSTNAQPLFRRIPTNRTVNNFFIVLSFQN